MRRLQSHSHLGNYLTWMLLVCSLWLPLEKELAGDVLTNSTSLQLCLRASSFFQMSLSWTIIWSKWINQKSQTHKTLKTRTPWVRSGFLLFLLSELLFSFYRAICPAASWHSTPLLWSVSSLLYFPTVCFCMVSARVAIFPLFRGGHLVYYLRSLWKLSHTIKMF